MSLEDICSIEKVFSESDLMTVLGRRLGLIGFNSSKSVTVVFKKEINSRLYFFEILKEFIQLSGYPKKHFFLGSFDFLKEMFMAHSFFREPNLSEDFFFLSFRGQSAFFSFMDFYFRQRFASSFFYSFIYIFLPPRKHGQPVTVFNLMSLLYRGIRPSGCLFSLNSVSNGYLVDSNSFLFSKKFFGPFGFISMVWQGPIRFLFLIFRYILICGCAEDSFGKKG